MLNKLRQRFGPTTRFLVSMAGIVALLLVVGGLWWGLPLRPRLAWKTERSGTPSIYISRNGQTIAIADDSSLAIWDVATTRKQGQRHPAPLAPTWLARG